MLRILTNSSGLKNDRVDISGPADLMQSSGDGRFTVVAYLPEPLSSLLSGLQSALPGDRCGRPHLTLLPPRPLGQSPQKTAAVIAAVLDECSPFDVELTDVCCFPGTNLLYLAMGAGHREVAGIHMRLDAASPEYQEEFEFRPHVTLGGPVPSQDRQQVMAATESAWRDLSCHRRFQVREMEFLGLAAQGKRTDWKQLWSREIGRGVTG